MKLDPAQERAIEHMDLSGGELCLDFANTVGNHTQAPHDEHLTNYAALVIWSRHAGILSNPAARHLLQRAERQSAETEAVFERAIQLREALYHIFSALSQGVKPKESDLEVLNRNLADALPHGRIIPADDGFRWAWESSDEAFDQMLWPVARSAEQLLTSGPLARVRECDGEDCNWLFIDTSKNHSRRWCSMNDCGNRAKVNRFYRRQRAHSGS